MIEQIDLRRMRVALLTEVCAERAFKSLHRKEQQAYTTAYPGSLFVAVLDLHLKKGALHRDLGIPEDQPISDAQLKRGEHSDNPKTRKRARLADTMRHKWRHK